MKRLALLLLFLCPLIAQSADIAVENRVKNKQPGYCCWACLETLGKHYKIEALHDLVERRGQDADWLEPIPGEYFNGYPVYEVKPKNVGNPKILEAKLKELGVKFYQDMSGDELFLTLANRFPCVVLMNAGCFGATGHAIIVYQTDDDYVYFVDPNHIENNYRFTWDQFRMYWSGVSLFLERGQKK